MTYEEALQELEALRVRLDSAEGSPDDAALVLADARRMAPEIRAAMRGES